MVGPRPDRARRSQSAFRWLARGPVVTGKQVERLLGHFTAEASFSREVFSIPRALYTFVQSSYDTPTALWDSCCYECHLVSSLVPLCFSNIRRPWHTTVKALDASPTGQGQVSTTLLVNTVLTSGSAAGAGSSAGYRVTNGHLDVEFAKTMI